MIKRNLFENLKKHLSQKEISFIIGPRQAGKTTLMLMLRNYLESKKQKTLFLNLDIEADKQFFTSQQQLIRKVQLEIGKNKGFVFIDEIQRKENAGLFLKGLYDLNLPYKFIVSGSGSVELKEKIHESLVGRKRIFELPTLTFEEFVNFKTNYRYENKLVDFFEVEKGEELLVEYLNFGGYPRAVLEDKLLEKQKILNEIYQSYLERDITLLLNIKKTEAFTNLLKIMAGQIGNLINFSELSSTLGISVKTVKEYLWYMEKTFILQKLTPYYKNLRKEITKSPIIYFSDLGLRNHSLGHLGNIKIENTDFLFQNFIYNLLKEQIKTTASKIHFWRTKDGAEIDFIISKGKEIIPVEVKSKKLSEVKISRSLKSFIKKYQPRKIFLINLQLTKIINFQRTKIISLPYYKLIKKVPL